MDNEAERVYKLLGVIFTGVAVAIISAALVAGFSFFSFAPLLIMLLTAIPFLGVGIGFLTHVQKKRNMENDVIEMGCTVDAVITEICEDYSITINGRHPWMLRCSYDDPQTNRVYEFITHTEGFHPSPRLIGGTVTVFVDPYDYTRYAVDLDTCTLPEEDLQDLLTGHSEIHEQKRLK
ncbi:MAG: hypothetical protein K6F23_08465 [Solobacterium sp.]|nr:hypothetical protein [Solobacterium sp.]